MEQSPRPSPPPHPSDIPRGEARRIPAQSPLIPNETSTTSFSLGDVYYTLFRHKWKIILCGLAGITLAAACFKYLPCPYSSEARLLIKYVMEDQGVGPTSGDVRITPMDRNGETIINTEVEILTSLDLMEQVAKAIGPEKILRHPGGKNDLNDAALLLQKHLQIEVAPHSSVLHVVYTHSNRDLVQPVLAEVIDQYLKRHSEIHSSSGSGSLATETEQLRLRLVKTEEALREARKKAGVINLDEAKKNYAQEIARLRQEISSTQADYAERASALQQITKQPSDASPTDGQIPADVSPDPSPDQIKEYRNLALRQEALLKREQDLLTYFKEDNTRVKDVHKQLAEVEELMKSMEKATPKLVRLPAAMPPATAGVQTRGTIDPATEAAQINALQVKIKVLNGQLEAVRNEADKTDQMEVTILQLTRQRDLEDTNYRKYAQSLEQTRINEYMGTNGTSNINQIQTPSPPFQNMALYAKIIFGMVVSGFVLGLVWAFGVELLLDHSVRRPIDVERMLQLPLFISIPRLGKDALALPVPAPAANGKPPETALTKWDGETALHPFHETLRDRLIGYFESKGLTHKPKLVAVTGIGHAGGVTTTAAGLASSLSETGDGNVLLVDMTQGQGSAQQFYQGKAVVGLDEILDTRGSAQIEENLFVVGQEPGGEKLSRILPNRFNKLVPKLKASNFDYIIFDMPPVSQISITPRLAGFMDMVLMVIESEKTDRELVRRATALLAESKAHVGAVLNKTKTYIPPSLYQENLGNG